MENVETKKIAAQTVIAMQHEGGYNDIGGVYRKLHAWARAQKISPNGKGFTVFLNPPTEFDAQSGLFEVCLPVPAGVKAQGEAAVKTVPACTVACVSVQGPYDQIAAHYTEMLAWLDAEGLEVAGPPREVYVKGPDATGKGNPKEYVTEIQFPVRRPISSSILFSASY